MFTCTGRISMHEPNLQNVPRTFSIPCEYLMVHSAVSDEVVEFNCRNIFKSAPGYVIVSADYCQLEMRILTHFSQDQVLMKIMNSDMDVFKAIAASWSHVCEDEVTVYLIFSHSFNLNIIRKIKHKTIFSTKKNSETSVQR